MLFPIYTCLTRACQSFGLCSFDMPAHFFKINLFQNKKYTKPHFFCKAQ